MSSFEAFDVIEQRLRALWTTTPLVFENEDWPNPDMASPFVFVEVFGDVLEQESIGGGDARADNLWREEGQLLMHVLTPSGTGTGRSRQLAKSLADLFRGEDIGGVEFRHASIGASDPGKQDGQYFRMTTAIFWRRDE
ncbi:hypothetical protein [Hyphomicrobium sp. ghe19]|uniref:hypothetical protein n=1 Tax=Hyphomicrobium sp. ghe19 TaxID=2682968 RepID=UPI0013668F24|nr:hypothetical protein HYPP_03769 [Hyphomicrobium sp. ghe19]